MLGLDVGERRIGVAVCDAEERVAVPLTIIDRKTEDAASRVAEIARAEGAEAVVVGLPLSLDGSIGPQARAVEAFARDLKGAGVAIDFWDERLTTAQIERRPARGPRRGERREAAPRRRARDDVVAAAILQNYIDARRARAAGAGR